MSSTSIIQTNDLTKTYGRDRGIEKINLRVEEGEIFEVAHNLLDRGVV